MMAYFLLGGLLLVGLFLLSRTFNTASHSARAVALVVVLVLVAAVLTVFALSGRIALLAPAGAFALWAMRAYLLARQIRAEGAQARPPQKSSGAMSRAEALDILGLDETATQEDVEAAYKMLIVKNHPDQGGTDWLAARLNEARATLLND